MDLHQKVRKDLPGDVHDSEFTSFGKAMLPWSKVNVTENVSLKFSLIREDILLSATETIAAPKKSLDSLAKIFPHNSIALNYVLAEQGGVCAVVNTTCYAWINTSGEAETQLHKITEQATWLKS